MSRGPEFHDRREAGRLLAAELAKYRGTRPLILALPRGGVPVAFEVAQALGGDLDLLMVRKLGAPGYPEFGIGAVVDGAAPRMVLNDEVVRQLAPSREYLEAELNRQLREIDRRRTEYMGDRAPIDPKGRVVIVVDDGIATGGTMRAALEGIRQIGPSRLIVAVPVAPASTVAALGHACDEFVCLASPEPFFAVGAHYADFDQTSDEEVVRLLRLSAGGQRSPA